MRLRVAIVTLAAVAACKGREPATTARDTVPPPPDSMPAAPGTPSPQPTADSAIRFTQAFYDWYAKAGTPFAATVRDSGSLFDPELLAALRADAAASAANQQEVVGLDWDPFVASQDPCPAYQAGAVRSLGSHVLVTVYGNCGTPGAPAVIAELERSGASWRFANFRHAGDTGSVLSDLDALRRERAAGGARSP